MPGLRLYCVLRELHKSTLTAHLFAPAAGALHAERGPGYISEAAQFAKGGFGEVWRATRRPAREGLLPALGCLL